MPEGATIGPTDPLKSAQEIATGVLANVTPDQLDLPTPCEKWTVADLIDHLVGAQHWGRCAVDGLDTTDTGEGSAQGDFKAAFADASAKVLASFQSDGALARTVNPGFGDIPAPALLGMVTTDTFQHSWDLATATGQDNNLDPQLADQLLDASRQAVQPAFRSDEGSIFGPEREAPDGANAAARLAAFLGRKV